ncbi:NAD(P)H-dependent oxidoreductase [Undibacterium amnicola]|uniref:NAD(P)H-dependent oxidoreductase n=1 Tax=Undibacterium amnicola TaxID=1834038 RepID=A0ABR6XS68_9BURK|nr:NAD(P)H-dependent oxidoreductase [Undibacterium amnicola]MBC3832334.1 NAD(P)H-dependent oxidoreductase [Undibacterium amnicola]
MATKRILIISAHSSSNSFGKALSEAYGEAARAAGHELKEIFLDQLQFDPILHQAYHEIQELETDLQTAQQAIIWAEHICFVYPIWWGSVPALLKGFIDRVFLPGFAFKYHPGKISPEGLLAGRSAQLIVTMDTPPWLFRWFYHAPGIRQMQVHTLELCGIKSVQVMNLGMIIHSNDRQRKQWLEKIRALAARVH